MAKETYYTAKETYRYTGIPERLLQGSTVRSLLLEFVGDFRPRGVHEDLVVCGGGGGLRYVCMHRCPVSKETYNMAKEG